jgi:hypothetical protein
LVCIFENGFTGIPAVASSFRTTNDHYRNCAAARHDTVDFQVVFHAQPTCFRSIIDMTTWSIFAVASLLWVTYGLLNRKPAIYVGNIIGLVMNLLMVNGILIRAGWTY